jgi:hypothetical protein
VKWVAITVACFCVACGSSTAPRDALQGDWSGTVAAAGSRTVADVHLMVIPDGHGSYDGTGVIAFGRDSSIYIGMSLIPLASDSVSITLFNGLTPSGKAPVVSIRGHRVGTIMDSRIEGGAFVGDQLTLARDQ